MGNGHAIPSDLIVRLSRETILVGVEMAHSLMASRPDVRARRVAEGVLSSKLLIEAVALLVSPALGLPNTNSALARDAVRIALRCTDAEGFATAAGAEIGALPASVANDVFVNVAARARAVGAMVDSETAASDGVAGAAAGRGARAVTVPGVAGTYGAVETLDAEPVRAGGLVVRAHAPAGKLERGGEGHMYVPPPRSSLLGLDRGSAHGLAGKRTGGGGEDSALKRSRISVDFDPPEPAEAENGGGSGGGGGFIGSVEEKEDAAGPGAGAAAAVFAGGARRFRGHGADTPSHPGGVDRAAAAEVAERTRAAGRRGVDASGAVGSRDRRDDRKDDRRDDRRDSGHERRHDDRHSRDVRSDERPRAAYPHSHHSNSSAPVREGIGSNEHEWDAPERLVSTPLGASVRRGDAAGARVGGQQFYATSSTPLAGRGTPALSTAPTPGPGGATPLAGGATPLAGAGATPSRSTAAGSTPSRMPTGYAPRGGGAAAGDSKSWDSEGAVVPDGGAGAAGSREEAEAFDKEFYSMEETGAVVDETVNPFLGDEARLCCWRVKLLCVTLCLAG